MKHVFYTLLFSLFFTLSYAQGDYDIKVKMNNYDNDTIIAGYYFGDRQLAKDTLYRQDKNTFRLSGSDTLNAGMYMLLFPGKGDFLQFFVTEEENKFEMEVDYLDFNKTKFKNAPENKRFIKYLNFLSAKRQEAETLNSKKESATKESDLENILKDIEKVNQDVTTYQDEIMEKYPSSMLAYVIRSNRSTEMPEFVGTEQDVKEQQYLFYKEHYFDNVDLKDPINFRLPFLGKRIDYYLTKLTVQHPDSIIKEEDYILSQLQDDEDAHRFYLSKFVNQAAKSKVVGMDAIYVHLVDNYYSKGKAPWIKEETLKKLEKNANEFRPVLMGNIGEDITLYRQDSTEFKLSDVETDFTVMMFWAPDCGHCKKSMPAVVDFYQKYKDQSVTLLAICTKHGEKYKSCWDSIEEKNMQDFINLGDQFHRSRFKSKYNVRTTPKFYVLDSNRKIIIKDIGATQLETVMDEIIKNHKADKLK